MSQSPQRKELDPRVQNEACRYQSLDRSFFSLLGDANRQISEYKFKLSKAEQDITTFEQNVSTLRSELQIFNKLYYCNVLCCL